MGQHRFVKSNQLSVPLLSLIEGKKIWKDGSLDLGWPGVLQTDVNNLIKNVFYKNILIDNWKEK